MSMTVSKLLRLAVLLPALCLPARATQTGRTGARPRPAEDKLARHLSAAETFQLSGDLARAGAENRAVAAIALARLGAIAVREGQLPRAVSLLSDSLATLDDSHARTDLAIAHMRLLEVDRALAEARAALALDEKNARAHHVLGKLLYMKADYAGALPALERAVVLEPDLDAAYTLGMTYLRLKQLERAKLLFEEMQAALGGSAQAHILFGRAYRETGYDAEAEAQFRRAIAVDPKAPRAHFYLAYVILLQGAGERLKEAADGFERELAHNPQDFFSHFFLGMLASGDGDHAKAARHLREATRLRPDSADAHLYLGQALAELQDPAAESTLRRAIALTPDVSQQSFQVKRAHFLLGRILLKSGRKAEAEKELAAARDLQGRSLESTRQEVSAILGQAMSSPAQGATAGQLAASSQGAGGDAAEPGGGDVLLIEETAPDGQEATKYQKVKSELVNVLAQAYHNLGVIAAQQGRPADGLAQFAAAARWQPRLPGLDRNWGIVSFRAARFAEAVEPLARQLTARPEDALARRMLGVSHYMTGDFRRAADTLRALGEEVTSDPELAYAYGVSLAHVEGGPAASALFERLAAAHAQRAPARLLAAQGFMLVQDYERALRELRVVDGLDPKLPQAHYHAGQALIRLNRPAEAEQEFRLELLLNPSDVSSKYHLAYVLLEQKQRTAEALALLREAVAARPDYADARYQLGKALVEQGDVAGAIEHLEAAARAEPSKDYIHYQLSIAYRRASRAADAERELQLYKELKSANRSRQQPGGQPNVP
jgi:tetratricopeptide (TPR) repeat protein